MDLLSAAYGAPSDEDDDEPLSSPPVATALTSFAPSPVKRPRWEYQPYLPPPPSFPQPPLPNAAPPLTSQASGRYVSKRERALLAASRASVDAASILPPQTTAEVDCSGEHFGPLRSWLEAKIAFHTSTLIYPSKIRPGILILTWEIHSCAQLHQTAR
jgi:hypothetical protein